MQYQYLLKHIKMVYKTCTECLSDVIYFPGCTTSSGKKEKAFKRVNMSR